MATVERTARTYYAPWKTIPSPPDRLMKAAVQMHLRGIQGAMVEISDALPQFQGWSPGMNADD